MLKTPRTLPERFNAPESALHQHQEKCPPCRARCPHRTLHLKDHAKGGDTPQGRPPEPPPQSLPPSGGKVSRRTPRRMRGLPFPVPLFREGQDKLRPYMGRKGSAPPQKTGAWGSVLLQIPPRPGSVLREQLRLLGVQLLQDLLVRLGGQIQPLIEVGAAAAGTQDGLLPPPLVHLGVVA